MSRVYNRLRIHATPTLADVFDRADLLVADNTSAMYEFASLDRPVVAVNLPTYRRDVHHGMRFWNLVPGLQCDTPQDLPDVIAAALVDPPEAQAMRTRAVDATYAHTDGGASERAASAILEHLCLTPTQRKGGPEPPPVNAGQ
jgi:CDP-glycerol glycerophosphotransferase